MASRFLQFLAELKRRKVYNVAAVYAAVGVAISIAIPDLFGAFGFPSWAAPLVIVVIAIGLPVALVLAWAYEVRPEESSSSEAASEEEAPSLTMTPPGDTRPSVAVLPFANLSADPENEYFSDGVTFDIINHLAKIADLRVISRTSIMGYRGTEKRLREIGRDLGVSSIVEGEVQRVEGRVRISAQLVDARTDEHLWADQYNRELLDVFAIQTDVAKEVAAGLRATLTSSEKERIETTPTRNFEAYTLYLKGRHFWDKRGEGLFKGLKYFQEALEIDPKFAFAHAGVADCYTLLGFYGAMAPSVAMPKAKTAAMRALEIDDRLAEAHSSLGFARVFFDWDMDRAEKDFQRALELNPGYAPARYWYAALLTTVGRFEEATDQSERAQASDPLSVFASAHFGWMLIGARQHKRAIEQLERALELDPTFPLAYWLLGAACLHDSRAEESVAAFEKSVELSGNALWFRAHLAWALGQSGRLHEARTVLSDLKVRREEEYVRASLLAIVCVGSGELDEAMDWLERAYEERDMWMPTFQVDPLFDPLKADPRFVALMEKVRVA